MATVSQVTADPALETQFFWERYKTTIIAVAVVLLLGGLGYAGYELYTARRASAATALLAKAKSAPDFQEVIDKFPGSEPAASAHLLLAAQLRSEKKFAEANKTLHQFIDRFPKHELITTAWMGVAANLQSLGKDDEALSTYQRLSTEYPQSFNAPLALLAQIPFLKAKDRLPEVRKICETVLTQYRDSVVANEAIQELMSLPQPARVEAPKPAASEVPIPMARPPEEPAASAPPAPSASP
ncbi:MAG TPA: tetratricopeptide repeat protein [Chthoniobacterales bacterium]|nr:tetratricopeptide repeat protein [Chthoniobacterales bacterium]